MKIVFIHIPKNCGTSVIKFMEHDKNFKSVDHNPVFKGQRLFVEKYNYKNIKHNCDKSFAIVRNPYERFLSAYNYLIQGGMNSELDLGYKNIISKLTLDEFIDNLDEFKYQIIHFLPQHLFICDGEKILIDFVCKFENLKDDLIQIDPKFENLHHLNKSNKIFDLNEMQKEKIYKNYESDFLIFGYEK